MKTITFPITVERKNITYKCTNSRTECCTIISDSHIPSMEKLRWLSSLTIVTRERTSEEQPVCG